MFVSAEAQNIQKQAAPALTLDVRWRDNPIPSARAAELAWQAIERSSSAASGALLPPRQFHAFFTIYNLHLNMKTSQYARR